MRIAFILNGEDVTANPRSGDRLVDLLREGFGLPSLKADCRKGSCGKCLVLLDGRLAPSCLMPGFAAEGREVVTLEGFAQTDEYGDVAGGFEEAGFATCGFCDSGWILSVAALLERNPRPLPEEIMAAAASVRCGCADPLALVRGAQAAAERRARRLYRRAGD